jgi:hypothetical protein
MHFLLYGFAPIIETSQSPPTLTSRSENSEGIVSFERTVRRKPDGKVQGEVKDDSRETQLPAA